MVEQHGCGFRRSSFCGSGGCVEVATLDGGIIAVRDSKDPAIPEHHYTADEWVAFIHGVKAGEFDFGLPSELPIP